jgi:hypothetical protein
MGIAFTAKIICDLSLWFGAAGLLLALFGSVSASVWPLAVMAACSSLCRALGNKKLWMRLLPLLPLAVCVFLINGILDAMLIIPPMAYVIILNAGKRYDMEYEQGKSYFKKASVVFLLFTAVAFGAGSYEIIEKHTAVYMVVFLLCGVLMLRQLRSDEYMQRQWRLRLIDMALLFGCLAGALFFSSGLSFHSAGSVLDVLYNNAVAPVVKWVGRLFAGIVQLISQPFKTAEIINKAAQAEENTEIIDQRFGLENTERVNGDSLENILTALAVLLFFIAAFILFRKMLANRRKSERREPGFYERRDKLPAAGQKEVNKRKWLPPRSPRDRVRWYYRKLLLYAKQKGLALPKSADSERVSRKLSGVFDRALLDEFRSIYISARYSSADVPAGDALRSKKLYEKIRLGKTNET